MRTHHSTISKDGKYLYFASNRPGGFGGIDIYRSKKQANGTWGKAQNLGPEVNTARNEDAPQIHTDDQTLFFSSTGHKGMGGYDIFKATWNPVKRNWGDVKNVGYPLNTPEDNMNFRVSASKI